MTAYRVDELAREAGATVRNVRAYQDRGLLPPPRREGRIGIYDDAHLARLRLIGRLLERGYTLGNIAELIGALERGHDVGDLLGLSAVLASPWSDEIAGHMSAAELAALFGGAATPDLVEQSVKLGLIEPDGDGYRVPSPRLLHAGSELVAAGIPLAAVLDIAGKLRRDVERISGRFVDLVGTHLVEPYGDDLPPPEDIARLAEVVNRLRPLAEMVVDAELARAMERTALARFGAYLERMRERGAAADADVAGVSTGGTR